MILKKNDIKNLFLTALWKLCFNFAGWWDKEAAEVTRPSDSESWKN